MNARYPKICLIYLRRPTNGAACNPESVTTAVKISKQLLLIITIHWSALTRDWYSKFCCRRVVEEAAIKFRQFYTWLSYCLQSRGLTKGKMGRVLAFE